jgi:Tol biopolymer transport system component
MLTPASWSSDGKSVALEVADPKDPEHLRDIWILSTDSWKAVPFVETPFTETGGIFSPDQRWLTFLSNESGRFELYAAAFPARNEKRQLTSSGVLGYIWSRKGDEIVFESESNEFYSIAVGGGGFAAPRLMFKADGDVVAADLSRDGSRMLVAVAPKRPMTPLTLVSDWRRSIAQ